MNKMYRQGDVLIQRVDSIPETAKEQKDCILAFGEMTGHHHSFDTSVAEKRVTPGGEEYFKVKGTGFDITLPIVRRWKNQVMVNHPEFGMIEFAQDDVLIDGGNATVCGNFGLLRHQEHSVLGIPAGLYTGGSAGRAVIQREYSPQAIRNVAD